MKLAYRRWHPKLDWSTPAGKALQALAAALPKKPAFRITVFGSAPLQLGLDPRFLSADVDIFSDDDFSEPIRELKLGRGQRPVYLEQNRSELFRAPLDWPARAFRTTVGNVEFWFPHPIDLLVSKLPRLAPKDLRAFKLVYELTGFPKEGDLLRALRSAVDLYRPPLPGEQPTGDVVANTRRVWRKLFAKEIKVQECIVQPALTMRAKAYGHELADCKGQLSQLSRPKPRRRKPQKA